MRKLILVAGLLGVLAVGFVVVQRAKPNPLPADKEDRKAVIAWSVPKVSETLFPGTLKSVVVHFTSGLELSNVAVTVSQDEGDSNNKGRSHEEGQSPQNVFTVSPITFASIAANRDYQITVTLTAPPQFEKQTFRAAVWLKNAHGDDNQTAALGPALPLILTTDWPPFVTVQPAQPSTIYVNSTTRVLIAAQVTDNRVISSDVQLLQIDPVTGSQSIVGALQDNGKNGVGNHVFTITLQPSTATPQLLTYQVSAAFRDLLNRSISPPITVAIVTPGVVLPPDPGPAGMKTLAGIDADGDGVRDDVQRLIATLALSSSNEKVLKQEAIVIQKSILGLPTADAARANSLQEVVVARCLSYLLGTSYKDVTHRIEASMLNTDARLTAYFKTDAQAGGWTTEGLPDGAAACQALP